MPLFIIKFIVGLLFILVGADKLTDGASAIARRFNVSTLIIGLTIVAFGTSMPELVVSSFSAIKGDNEIALGNVIGSNLFNVFAIVGLVAVISPLSCQREVLRRDMPINIAASLVLVGMVFMFDDGRMMLNRWEGIVLLVIFAAYLFLTIRTAIRQSHAGSEADGEMLTAETVTETAADGNAAQESQTMKMSKACIYVVLGLSMLILGGDALVDGASGIARQLGVSQSVIALTIVAIGTSLPELATSAVAARKGDNDMAIGNVVGSNIFNILFILGVSSTISPMDTGNILAVDFIAFLASAIILWLFCINSKRMRVNRIEGAFMLLCIIAYYVYVVQQV